MGETRHAKDAPIKSDTIVHKNGALETKDADDGVVLYDEASGQIIFLNLTAAAVLQFCATPCRAGLIAPTLQAMGHDSIDDDAVFGCLAELAGLGLITVKHA